jgi:hypothetical protein
VSGGKASMLTKKKKKKKTDAFLALVEVTSCKKEKSNNSHNCDKHYEGDRSSRCLVLGALTAYFPTLEAIQLFILGITDGLQLIC